MKTLRVGGGIILVLFALAQLIRPVRNVGVSEGPHSIVKVYSVPTVVQTILRRACYDCHSNETQYPWYSNVQPAAWWLNQHIEEGKGELNFSEFGSYQTKRALRRLESIADEVHDHSMPLKSYLWMHPEARLSEADIMLVEKWTEDLGSEIENH